METIKIIRALQAIIAILFVLSAVLAMLAIANNLSRQAFLPTLAAVTFAMQYMTWHLRALDCVFDSFRKSGRNVDILLFPTWRNRIRMFFWLQPLDEIAV